MATLTIPDPLALDAVNLIYRSRFHIRVRPSGSDWDAVSIQDGVWFQGSQTPEEAIARAIAHIDATFPPEE